MINRITFLFTTLCVNLIYAQTNFYNEGGDGLVFYVGQDHIVQAEGDVENASGATMEFEAAGNPAFALRGNFTNSTTGTYTLGTEYIEFNGSSLQTADFGGDDIYGLSTNNSSHVSIDRNVTITGELALGTGHTISTSSSHITLETGATVSGADDDSHNFGPIAKNFTQTSTFTFPVGDGTSYRPSGFTPTTVAPVTMRSMYYGSKYPQWRYNSPLYKVSQVEYWDMYRTSGTETGSVTLSWDANSDVDTYTDLTVAYLDSWWSDAGGNGHTGNNTAGTVTSDAAWDTYNTFFTLGTTTNLNPLPVELSMFDVTRELDLGKIEWETSAEINSDYFSVLRSFDGVNFEEIGQVKAAGNSTTTNNYTFYDINPKEGANFYRLVTHDLDGTSESFEIKRLTFTTDGGEFAMNIYPNPVRNEARFDFTAAEEGKYVLKMYNIAGMLVYSSDIIVAEGSNSFNINMGVYNGGKYFVQLISPTGETLTTPIEKI